MKKILYVVFVVALALTLFTFGAGATETGATETTDVFTETGIVLDEEEISQVIEVLDEAENKPEAILALAEKLGITTEQAETIINSFIVMGDEYFGDNAAWVSFSNAIGEDMQFWTVVLVAGAAVLSIIGMVFVMIARVAPNAKAAKAYSEQGVKFSKEIAEANSETLENLKALFAKALEKESEFEEIIKAKEDKILLLEAAYDKEHRAVVTALCYALRVQKLICDRTSMPMTDKATIDNFYALGVDQLKTDMDNIDIEKLENILAILDEVGGSNGESKA